jgi:hypothetical protein
VAIRTPWLTVVIHESGRNEIANAVDPNPLSVTGQGIVRIQSFVFVVIRIRHDCCRRFITRFVVGVPQDNAVLKRSSIFVHSQRIMAGHRNLNGFTHVVRNVKTHTKIIGLEVGFITATGFFRRQIAIIAVGIIGGPNEILDIISG